MMKAYRLFWVSTSIVNVSCSAVAGSIISRGDLTLFLESFPYMLISVGLWVSLLYKELFEKEAYYYYYNKGISKWILLTSTFIVYLLIFILFKLCHNLLR